MIPRFFLTCTFLCAIFLTEAQTALPGEISGTDSGIVSGKGWLDEAARLYAQGDYFGASIVYERLLFENCTSAEQYQAVIGKTACLKKEHLYEKALNFLNNWQSYPFPDSCKLRLHSQQILCSYLGGHFENTLSLADRWPYLHPKDSLPPWVIVCKILSLNELQRWSEAGQVYRTFVAAHPLSPAPPDPYAELPRLKNPKTAQWLSTFLPGAGQFYAGRPGEALLSLLIQGAGIYIGILSFEQQYYIRAWLVGAALFGSFHMGGIRRAEILVAQYNRKKVQHFNAGVKKDLLQLLDGLQP